MSKHVLKLYLVCGVLLAIAFGFRFYKSHDHMPIGCDEFGYLQLAEKFRGEDDHTDFISNLATELKAEGFEYERYAWMVTPHAHHIHPETGNAINQYQPGTSLILSFISKKGSQYLFPVIIVLFSGFILIILRIKISGKLFEKAVFTTIMFFIFGFFSPPFVSMYAHINSLGFTFISFILAGMMFKKHPFYTLVFLLFCVNFRIVNVILLLPVLIGGGFFFPFNLRHYFRLTLIGLLMVSPLLIHNFWQTGNPFALTYSSGDTSWVNFEEFIDNMKFYFSFKSGWFKANLITILLVLVFGWFRKIGKIEVVVAVAILLLNYSFFLVHKVQMDYYPYASSLFNLGLISGIVLKPYVKWRFKLHFLLVCSIVCLIVGLGRFSEYEKKDRGQSLTLLMNEVKSSDVVWCDMFTGTTEYVNGNIGMRYYGGSPESRKFVVNSIHKKNKKQVFIIEDLLFDKEELIDDLKALRLNFKEEKKGDWTLISVE
jgi:hypothetical protein